ncbi:CobD/CbiB family protein [Saccharopolyspora gregorii]|uniref:hypothetical protein n=1 Tax=Saccharopolyspora gregorii TaxID=33914 RepID=UPI0021ABC476|nr:hypothetical protein [Saccharopolyspora gregorii]
MTTSPSHHCESRASSSVVFHDRQPCRLVSLLGRVAYRVQRRRIRPGATNQQIIGMFFAVWIVPWLAGLLLVSIAIASRLRRMLWILLGLTGIMLAVSLITYAIG